MMTFATREDLILFDYLHDFGRKPRMRIICDTYYNESHPDYALLKVSTRFKLLGIVESEYGIA